MPAIGLGIGIPPFFIHRGGPGATTNVIPDGMMLQGSRFRAAINAAAIPAFARTNNHDDALYQARP